MKTPNSKVNNLLTTSCLFLFCLLLVGCDNGELAMDETLTSNWISDGNYSVFSCISDKQCTDRLVISYKFRESQKDFEENRSRITAEEAAEIDLATIPHSTINYLQVKGDGIHTSSNCGGLFDTTTKLWFPINPQVGLSWDWFNCQNEVSRSFNIEGINVPLTVPAGTFNVFVLSDSWNAKYYYHRDEGFIRIDHFIDGEDTISYSYVLMKKNF